VQIYLKIRKNKNKRGLADARPIIIKQMSKEKQEKNPKQQQRKNLVGKSYFK